ncbi:zinc dependent phospholipase C family protein [Shewanella sp.]|uniref:zinc dependent phospholipase C family protein n=1 Tax=Shewanella sp. TaxID=50422 RepID=UPI0035622CEF
MPGAFAHITAVNIALSNAALASLQEMPQEARFILSQNIQFSELGAVSPDYPYLAIGSKEQNTWADLMHYTRTGQFIQYAAMNIRQLTGEAQERAFAWLCGYISHVIADITIHPVVEKIVGPYEQNAKAHRNCEMNQDAYIWQRLNLGQIGLADRVRLNIGNCIDTDTNKLANAVTTVWLSSLKQNYPIEFQQSPPNIDLWHKGFQKVVDAAEESYRLFPFARHVAVNAGLTYPMLDEVAQVFIRQIPTPRGPMDYDEVFDLAVQNIRKYVTILGQVVFQSKEPTEFLDWNLDTGRAPDGSLTAWSE